MQSETKLSSSSTPQEDIEIRNKDNPHVFMDISIDGICAGKLVIELYKDLVPKIAENFRALCTGEKGSSSTTGKKLHYKGCEFYYIVEGITAEGGDIESNDGNGGESIYGGTFEADTGIRLRSKRGMIYMAHCRETIDSKFILVFQNHTYIDSIYVIAGRIIKGMETLAKIEQLGDPTGKPTGIAKITNCGEIPQGNVIESIKGEKKIAGKRSMPHDKSFDEPVKKQRDSDS